VVILPCRKVVDMKNLVLLFLVVCSGCSSTGEFPRLFVVEDSGLDTETEAVDAGEDSSSDSDADTETSSDSGIDSGTGLPCDAGSCCISGEVALGGAACVPDILPEIVSDSFHPDTMEPFQFRCPEPTVCGSGDEIRQGETVCDGISPSCSLTNIEWGAWYVDPYDEYDDPNSVCNILVTDGYVYWSTLAGLGPNRARTGCPAGAGYTGECVAGVCVPLYSGAECDLNFADMFCDSCTNNCYENGGSTCGGSGEDRVCECGTGNPACDEGFRCIFDMVIFDYSCVPE